MPNARRPLDRHVAWRLVVFILCVAVSPALAQTRPAPATAPAPAPGGHAESAEPPNVLLIMIDDVAANLHSVHQDSPVQTPHLERLAERSTWFSRAYNVAPACNPSRMALVTGVHASRSGVYYNSQKFPTNFIKDVKRLHVNFRDHGYLTANYGKYMHTKKQYEHDFTPGHAFFHNYPDSVTNPDKALRDHIIPGSLREATSSNFTWGILPDTWDQNDPEKFQQDTQQANRTIALLNEKHDRPFFVACGFWRPHVTWEVPKRYYDLYPLEDVELPAGYKENDLDDLPTPGKWIARPQGNHKDIVDRDLWKKALQGYYASTSYVDEQIGRVLDALEASEHNDNTIVIFFSDNGMHLGEKDHWLKFALWEQTCKVMFAVSVPGQPTQTVDTAVSLIDIYSTLINLTPITPPDHKLDGEDLTPLLTGESDLRGQSEKFPAGRPVLQTYGRANHAVSDERYRYIRYRNGDEELYDHQSDPHEWHNLASAPESASIKARLAEALPEVDAPDTERYKDQRSSTEWRESSYQ